MIHLSASSESESQSWISCIRAILWPPTTVAQLEKTLGSHFEISIIDNEFSFRAGLIGMYGHLQVTSEKVVLTHPQTNHVVQQWLLPTVGFKLLPQHHPDDHNRVVAMITDATSVTGYGTIVLFCAEAEQLIQRVHSVRQMFVHKSYGDLMKEELTRNSASNADSPCHAPQTPVANRLPATDLESRRALLDPWVETIARESISGEVSPQETAAAQRRLWNNKANITEVMLDTSINFRSACQPIPEEARENGRRSECGSSAIKKSEEGEAPGLQSSCSHALSSTPKTSP